MPAGWTLLRIFADFSVDEAFNLVNYAALGRLRRLRRVSQIDSGVQKNPERSKDGATAKEMAAVGSPGSEGLAGDAAAMSSDMSTDGSIGVHIGVNCSGRGSEYKLDDKEGWPVPPNSSSTAAIGVFSSTRLVSVSGDDSDPVSMVTFGGLEDQVNFLHDEGVLDRRDTSLVADSYIGESGHMDARVDDVYNNIYESESMPDSEHAGVSPSGSPAKAAILAKPKPASVSAADVASLLAERGPCNRNPGLCPKQNGHIGLCKLKKSGSKRPN
jgi:hypothetical protein